MLSFFVILDMRCNNMDLGISVQRAEDIEKRMDELSGELEQTTDQTERENIQKKLQLCSKGILALQHEREVNDLVHVPSVIQTDPVSIATHSEVNKATITLVVSGVKSAAKVAAMHYVGQNLTDFIEEKIVTPVEHPASVEVDYETIPGKTIMETVVTPEQVVETEVPVTLVDRDAMSALDFGDILPESDVISTRASQGATAINTDIKYLRGVSFSGSEKFVGVGTGDPCINGKGAEIISAADGLEFDIAGRVTVTSDVIEELNLTLIII
jgi:hypothetical protein